MKTNTRNNVRLGIFVSLSIFLLITGIYFIGARQHLFGSTLRVHVIFKDISGLQVGNNVRSSGINVGIVESIFQISDSTVQVELLIASESTKFIKNDAIAMIGSDGLMGNKIVIISPGRGSGIAIKENDFLGSGVPVNLDDILLNLKKTSENSARISDDLATITNNVREGKGTIGMLLMDTVFAEDLALTVGSIKEGAGGFKENMDKAGNSFLLKRTLRDKKKDKK